jgi:8-oxo-dGTP pyrophosphatase MutT (NUDIX family)
MNTLSAEANRMSTGARKRSYNQGVIDSGTLRAIRNRLGAALAPPRQACRPLWVARHVAGWLDDARAARLAAMTDVFDLRSDGLSFVAGISDARARSLALERVARALEADGLLTAWRDERYAVAPELGAPPWFELERAAARFFGIYTYAAHVNGLVRRDTEVAMWIARRSPTKSIDPGMLDNLVGGGIASGQTVAAAVVKEAWEEAGIAASVAALAQPAGAVQICREQPDGLQRETIFVHDLWLPAEFVPACQDDEVVGHRLVPLSEVGSLIANDVGQDVVTADAALVMVDCLLRHGAIAHDASNYGALDALRHPPDILQSSPPAG